MRQMSKNGLCFLKLAAEKENLEMDIQEFRALVERRRSIRGYGENRAVSDELVCTILGCARRGRSGGNGQP